MHEIKMMVFFMLVFAAMVFIVVGDSMSGLLIGEDSKDTEGETSLFGSYEVLVGMVILLFAIFGIVASRLRAKPYS